MLNILLINYYWPPCGGPSVQRWVDLSRYLEASGIRLHVVTIAEEVATFPSIDRSLEARIAASTRVYKTEKTGELFSLYKNFIGKGKVPATGLTDMRQRGFLEKMSLFIRGNFFLPDPRIGWNRYAYSLACSVLQREDIALVVTAGPPQSSHLIGRKLKKRFPCLKWVMDLHDYWSDHFILRSFYRTALAGRIDQSLEKRCLNDADAVMVHSPKARSLYRSKVPEAWQEKFWLHTMGYQEALFPTRPESLPQAAFTLVYVGTLSSTYHPEPVFKAIRAALLQNPDMPFVFRLAGLMSDEIYQLADQYALRPYIEVLGYLPHAEAVAHIQAGSMLLLMNPRLPEEEWVLPGKVFEYLAAFKPILSISSGEADAAQLIEQFDAGKTFSWDDAQQMQDYLDGLMKRWKRNESLDLPVNPRVAQFSRREEAQRLSEKLHHLAGAATD